METRVLLQAGKTNAVKMIHLTTKMNDGTMLMHQIFSYIPRGFDSVVLDWRDKYRCCPSSSL